MKDDKLSEFLKGLECPFKIRVQDPCDTKSPETIELPSEIIARSGKTLLYSKDDGESWFKFDLDELTKPKKNKWHDVKSVTPEPCKNVLVCDTIGHVRIGYFSHQTQWYVFPTGIAYDLAYWRELPKPPKEVGGK